MTCPRCGLAIEQGSVSWCPRCGQQLQAPGAMPDATTQAPEAPQATGTPPTASESTPMPLYPVYPAPAPPDAPPGGEPGQYPAYPSGYGVPAPPGYAPGYGSPVPPGYNAPPWTSPGMSPPPAPRKRPGALVVGSVVALAVVVLVVAIASGSALLLRRRGIGQAPTQPAATATATPIMPGMNGRTPLMDDTLMSDASDWPNLSNCFVRSDGYHIRDSYFCYPGGTEVSNATISVRAELLSGPLDLVYGIAFRILDQPHHLAFYFFGVSASGDWTFGRVSDGTWVPIIAPQPSDAIQIGPRLFTTLTVNATGSHFVFYAGRKQIGTSDDSTLTEGYSGLSVSGTGEALFTNFILAN